MPKQNPRKYGLRAKQLRESGSDRQRPSRRLRAALRDIEEQPPSRPVIRLDDFERPSDIADATLAALASRNILHRRGGHVVAVRGWSQDEAPKRTAEVRTAKERPQVAIREGSPVVRMVRGGALDYVIDREVSLCAHRQRQRKDCFMSAACPKMIAGVGGDQVLPPLESIIQVPSLRPDGTVIDVPGYDVATGYYLASKVRLSHLHASPTKDNAIRARDFLKSIFG